MCITIFIQFLPHVRYKICRVNGVNLLNATQMNWMDTDSQIHANVIHRAAESNQFTPIKPH